MGKGAHGYAGMSRCGSGWLACGLRAVAWAAFAVLLVLSAMGGVAEEAYAEEADENLVDPTQRADNSFIYDTDIESLLDQAALNDGHQVQVEGEVIGDRIAADGAGSCWITLTARSADDEVSISVFMSEDQANQIDHYGKYGVTGTILQVRGIYHQACNEHDGLPDIHATNSAVVERGVETPDRFVASDFLPGFIAILVGFVLMGVFYFARERMR